MRKWLVLCFWLCASAAQAADFDYTAFARIPVQHEGRIKPLSTLAHVTLARIHGRDTVDEMTAIAWLAHAMFNPADAMQMPLFPIRDPQTLATLRLTESADHYYSFTTLSPALAAQKTLIQSLSAQPARTLSATQRNLLALHEHVGLYGQILFSCTLFLPLAITLPPDMVLPASDTPAGFLDYYPDLPAIEKRLRALVKQKGSDVSRYSGTELALSQAGYLLNATRENGSINRMLKLLPPPWQGEEWLSPWEIFDQSQGSPQTRSQIKNWQTLALAYQRQDTAGWHATSEQLAAAAHNFPQVRPFMLTLETWYYALDPLGLCLMLYVAAGVLLCVRRLNAPARVTLWVAALLHVFAIITRVLILERPPVGTLYESMIFVSAISVWFGLYVGQRLGLITAALSGAFILLVSQNFGQADDTMSMLIAVLNTHFWLTTHVLCVTTGYGFGIAATIAAHAYLILRLLKKTANSAFKLGYTAALLALFFTTLGTMLGGIWADQSWGRFWGWDPKENGALLICLWLIWLLHAKTTGRFRETGVALSLALLGPVIATSWLGVNLLGTGLHSYGFTDKAAFAFIGYCATEMIFAMAAFFLLKRPVYAHSR